MDVDIAALAGRYGLSIGEVQGIADNARRLICRVKPSLADYPFTASTNFKEVGVDSLLLISMLFEFEEFFDISIVDRDMDDVRTVGEALDTVTRLVVENAQTAKVAQ